MTEHLVAVACFEEPSRCHRLAAHLLSAGIPAIVDRTADPIPLGTSRFAVSVPRGAVPEAARQMRAWCSGGSPSGGAYRTAAERGEEEELPARHKRLALYFAVGVAFGFGHVYAREYLAGLILGLGQLASLVLAAVGVGEIVWAFPALVALDAWGASRAVERENEGRRREPAAQLAATLPAVAMFLATAAVLLPPRGASDRPTVTWPAIASSEMLQHAE